jgi:selenide,water dikinase
LAQVLRHLHNLSPTQHDDLLVGIEGSDDAGVFRLNDEVALVQTVDFFTPIVDDPYDWGRIAAANSLSDVYAMGGTPLTALQVVGWPRDALPFEMLGEVLRGGADVLAQAGCTLVGGHTVDDPEPKYGMAITGLVHPDEIVSNQGARPGDKIILTKPLGTGLIATAIKRGLASDEQSATAVATMVRLNDGAAAAMRRVGARAATDVTGYGLLGHLGEMVRASDASARIRLADVPLLAGVRDLAEAGVVPGGTVRNLKSAKRFVSFGELGRAEQVVLADAQTSGGLLVAVEAPLEAAFHQALAEEDVAAATIGEFVARAFEDGPSGRIEVVAR